MRDALQKDLASLRSAGLYRTLRQVAGPQDRVVTLEGRAVVNFASNDYLGLASHPALRDAMKAAIDRYGAGAAASRLITGTMTPHLELERRLAEFEDLPAAILFSSGYNANVGAIPALVGRGDAAIGDRLNHASLVDGCPGADGSARHGSAVLR